MVHYIFRDDLNLIRQDTVLASNRSAASTSIKRYLFNQSSFLSIAGNPGDRGLTAQPKYRL